MVLLGIVLLLTAAIPVLYGYLTTKRSPRALWRSSVGMLAWPEAIVFGRHQGTASTSLYASLALLLIVSSVLLVSVVGLAVQVTRIRRDI